MNYKKYLMITHVLAGIIFVGLVAWNFYFESEFDQFREPYSGSDFQERQVDSVEVGQDTSGQNNNEIESNNQQEASEEPRVDIYGVSSVHPLAADIGMQIIEDGGNAVDAAVAVSFMLNVVEPYGSGIGGGGLMLVHDPEHGAISYDYREAAPMSGERPTRGVAVPGLVKGMEKIHQDLGTMDWSALVDPAVDTAQEGFQIGHILHEQIGNATRYLELDPEDQERFFPGGQALEVNGTLIQEELSETLSLIRDNGAAGFYEGEIGEAMQQEVGFTGDDLTSYEAKTTEPASAEIDDFVVYGGPSPSSGTVVVQALQMAHEMDMQQALSDESIPEDLQLGDLVNYDELSHDYIHLMTEITKIVYSSRLDTLGDPEFDDIDHSEFTSPEYIASLLDQVSYDQITPGDTSELFDSPAEENDSRHTTHFVIVDKEGRMVSATHSLGEFFGSGLSTNGFFLNNQLDNFSDNPESLNRYEPGKRPRTFVAPMIFEEHGQAALGLGSPGGRRIPAMLFQTIMEYQYGLDDNGEEVTLQDAITEPRFYTEEDVIYVEEELDEDVNMRLREMGYSVVGHGSPLFYGGIQGLGVVINDEGRVEGMYGGGDPRRRGAWQIESE